MARALIIAAVLAGAAWYTLLAAVPASSHHSIYLPLTPNTPLMQQVIQHQEYTYCLDSRASAYPNFRTQLADVVAEYTARTGVKAREVPVTMNASLHLTEKFTIATAAGCHVLHLMPDTHGCSGCAAWIGYANRLGAVYVEYKYQLGYTDWRSTHGHELGHGVLGLHEQYVDEGSIQCTRRQDTVMDCGSGVRYPTTLDVTRGCAIIKTGWCGQAPTQVYPFWANGRWWFEDGWSFAPNSGCGEWFMPDQRRAWGECDPSWGGRWNPLAGIWTMPGSTYHPGSNTWWSGGLVLP